MTVFYFFFHFEIWQLILYRFKMYNITIWCMSIYCRMITTVSLVNSLHLTVITFFLVMRNLKLHSPSNFQLYTTVLLTLVTMPYIPSPQILYLWPPSPISPTSHSSTAFKNAYRHQNINMKTKGEIQDLCVWWKEGYNCFYIFIVLCVCVCFFPKKGVSEVGWRL